MKKRPLISIITVSLNAADTIIDTLRSCPPNSDLFEHIVIDGHSTDGTLEIVERYPNKNLKLDTQVPLGIYHAMNLGVKLANGEYIHFLNADDFVIDRTRYEDLIRVICKKREIEIFAFAVNYVFPQDVKTVRRVYYPPDNPLDSLAKGVMPPHPGMIVKKSLFKKVGLFNTDYQIAGDFEWCARLFSQIKVKYDVQSEIIVSLRTGGLSTRGVGSYISLTKQFMKALKQNNIQFNAAQIAFRCFKKIRQSDPKYIINQMKYPKLPRNGF